MSDVFTTSLPKTELGAHVCNDLWSEVCLVEADLLKPSPKLLFRTTGSIGGSDFHKNAVYINENEIKKLWAICYAGYIIYQFTRKKKRNNISINIIPITKKDMAEKRAVEHLKWAVGYKSKCPSNFFQYDTFKAKLPSSLRYYISKLFDAAFSFIAFHEIWHIINKDEVPNIKKYNTERPHLDSNNKKDVKRIKEWENQFNEAVINENQSDSNALCSLIKLYNMKNRNPFEPLLGLSLALFYLVTSEILSKPIISSNNYLQQQNIPRLHPRGYIRLFNCLSTAISTVENNVNSPIYNFTAHLMRQLFPESVYQQTNAHSSAKAYLNELCEVIDKKYNLRD